MPELQIIAYHTEISKLRLAKILRQRLSYTMREAFDVMHCATRGERPVICVIERGLAQEVAQELAAQGVIAALGEETFDAFPHEIVLPPHRPDLTPSPFLKYSLQRMARQFPEWSSFLREFPEEGSWAYQIPSPNNVENILYISLCKEQLIIKFAVRGSHEHYALSDADGDTDDEKFEAVWSLAWEEYLGPVLENRLVIVWHEHGLGGSLTFKPEQYVAHLRNRGVTDYRIETWS